VVSTLWIGGGTGDACVHALDGAGGAARRAGTFGDRSTRLGVYAVAYDAARDRVVAATKRAAVHAGSSLAFVRAFARDGAIAWEHTLAGRGASALAIDGGGRVHLGCDDGSVLTLVERAERGGVVVEADTKPHAGAVHWIGVLGDERLSFAEDATLVRTSLGSRETTARVALPHAPARAKYVAGVGVDEAAERLYFGDDRGQLHVVSSRGAPIAIVRVHAGPSYVVAAHPETGDVLVGESATGQVAFLEAISHERLATLGTGEPLLAAVPLEGARFALVHPSGTVRTVRRDRSAIVTLASSRCPSARSVAAPAVAPRPRRSATRPRPDDAIRAFHEAIRAIEQAGAKPADPSRIDAAIDALERAAPDGSTPIHHVLATYLDRATGHDRKEAERWAGIARAWSPPWPAEWHARRALCFELAGMPARALADYEAAPDAQGSAVRREALVRHPAVVRDRTTTLRAAKLDGALALRLAMQASFGEIVEPALRLVPAAPPIPGGVDGEALRELVEENGAEGRIVDADVLVYDDEGRTRAARCVRVVSSDPSPAARLELAWFLEEASGQRHTVAGCVLDVAGPAGEHAASIRETIAFLGTTEAQRLARSTVERAARLLKGARIRGGSS
jgi:hypothetical protein